MKASAWKPVALRPGAQPAKQTNVPEARVLDRDAHECAASDDHS